MLIAIPINQRKRAASQQHTVNLIQHSDQFLLRDVKGNRNRFGSSPFNKIVVDFKNVVVKVKDVLLARSYWLRDYADCRHEVLGQLIFIFKTV